MYLLSNGSCVEGISCCCGIGFATLRKLPNDLFVLDSDVEGDGCLGMKSVSVNFTWRNDVEAFSSIYLRDWVDKFDFSGNLSSLPEYLNLTFRMDSVNSSNVVIENSQNPDCINTLTVIDNPDLLCEDGKMDGDELGIDCGSKFCKDQDPCSSGSSTGIISGSTGGTTGAVLTGPPTSGSLYFLADGSCQPSSTCCCNTGVATLQVLNEQMFRWFGDVTGDGCFGENNISVDFTWQDEKTATGTLTANVYGFDYDVDLTIVFDWAARSCVLTNSLVGSCINSFILADEVTTITGGSVSDSCSNGIQDGDELGVDCGSTSLCPDQAACADDSCSNGIMDGDEQGVDCGSASLCPDQADCVVDTCNNGIMDGDEQGIDCGSLGLCANQPDCPV